MHCSLLISKKFFHCLFSICLTFQNKKPLLKCPYYLLFTFISTPSELQTHGELISLSIKVPSLSRPFQPQTIFTSPVTTFLCDGAQPTIALSLSHFSILTDSPSFPNSHSLLPYLIPPQFSYSFQNMHSQLHTASNCNLSR